MKNNRFYRKLILITVILFSTFFMIDAQTSDFTEATGSGMSEEGGTAKWNFSLNGNDYEISYNGRGKREGNSFGSFRLPLGKDELVSRVVYFADYRNDLIFLYEASIGGDGLGYVARFDGKTLKPKWSAAISGFNVSQGLIENQFAYLTAIGFVAKINLITGKYVWKHDYLYRKYKKDGAFNIFELPQLAGSNVVFTEKLDGSSENKMIVNKTTGKIIRVVLGK